MPKVFGKEEILKKIEEMESENRSSKAIREIRKKLWKEQSLQESLYNDDGEGHKVPSAEDIDQISYSQLDYVLSKQGINDCYLLTDLMGLVKTQPKFIIDDLIKVKSANEVVISFYELEPNIIERGAKGDPWEKKYKYKSTGSKVYYTVKKSEALAWKTYHKALWPVVIEIAYAKYLLSMKKSRMDELIITVKRDLHEKKIIAEFGHSINEEELKKLVDDTVLREYFEDHMELPSHALTALTGKETTTWFSLNYKPLISSIVKGVLATYSSTELRVYEKIKTELCRNKIIVVNFGNKTSYEIGSESDEDIALKVIALAESLKKDFSKTVQDLVKNHKKQIDAWLEKNSMTLEQLKNADHEVYKKFILDTVYSDVSGKVSATKTDILPMHAYLVLDAVESGERKFIIIKNPHGKTTAINYRVGKRALPPEIKIPREIEKVKNECAVELNHFCKMIHSISYDD